MEKVKRNSLKIIALLAAAALIFCIFTADRPAAAYQTSLKDISSTPFYSAVTDLESAGIVNGYGDSSYKPYNSLSRAEACTLIYKAFGDSGLAPYSHYNFEDVSSSHWAADYIYYCSAMGIASGYPDRTFKPDAKVTYNELISMIVRARNLNDGKVLSWPDGYINAARNDGMLKSLINVSFPKDGTTLANRGNTAVVISHSSSYNKKAASGPRTDYLADPNMDCTIYGIVQKTYQGKNSYGDDCTIARILMGDTAYDIVPSQGQLSMFENLTGPADGLVMIDINSGQASSVTQVTSSADNGEYGIVTPASSETAGTEFCKLNSVSSRTISYSSYNTGSITRSSAPVYYRLSREDGQLKVTPAEASDMSPNDMICSYTVTSGGMADVTLIVKPKDISSVLTATDNRNVMLLK